MLENQNHPNKTTLPELPDVIRNAVNEGNLVVFIGAGVSALVGCMRWPDLAKHLAEECFKKNIINYYEKEQLKNDRDHLKVISVAFELLRRGGYEKHFDQKLREALEPKHNRCSDIYDMLWKFGGAFITTNADKCFHKNFLPENILKWPKDFENEGIKKRRLYKIHGCISDPTSLVFTTKDYLATYSGKKDPAFHPFMKKVFSNERSILFVGYGLKEFELLSLLIDSDRQKTEYNRFALMPYYKRDQHLLKFDKIHFRNFGINILEYYIDEKGYIKLYEVIKKWSNELSETTKLAHEDHELIDEVVK